MTDYAPRLAQATRQRKAVDEPPPEPRAKRLLLGVAFAALVAFAAWSRWPLVTEGLWRDEAAAVYVARSVTAGEFLERQMAAEYTPPLFNAVLAVWGRMAGFEERPLKGFAFMLGMLAIGGIAMLANELFGGRGAFLASCLAVNNPILIGLSAELRPYSLSILLASLSLVLVHRMRRGASERFGNGRRVVLLACCLALLAYSHLAGAIVVAVVGLIGLVSLAKGDRSAYGWGLLGAAGVALGVLSLWLPQSWSQFRAGLPYEASLPLAARWGGLMRRLGQVLPNPGPWLGVGGIAGVAFGAFVARERCGAKRPGREFGFALVIAAALAVFLSLGLFSQTSRYLAIPAALLAVAAGGVLDSGIRMARKFGSLSSILLGGGVAILLIGSFLERSPLYRDLSVKSQRGVAKSGIRTLCRDQAFMPGTLAVVAPDYLATTLLYYCGSRVSVRGFVLGIDAPALDWKTFKAAWESPQAVPEAVQHARHFLTEHRSDRFLLVWDAPWDGPPLFFASRVEDLRNALSERYTERTLGRFEGRIESVTLTEFLGAGETVY